MKKAGSFGAPKPLAGQAGYKMTESDMLEKEAKDMEERLKMLNSRMQNQDSGALMSSSAGGSKWGSSKAEKGGIRSFGKEVKEKTKKRLEAGGGVETLMRTAAAKQGATATTAGAITSSSSSRKGGGGGAVSLAANPVGGKYDTKDVILWGMLDVQDWLKATPPLEQYAEVFEQNQINGSTLIDITLEDLDYMEVKVLMHRKLILKSAEELRKSSKGGGGAAALPRPPSGQRKGAAAAAATIYEPVQVGAETKPQKAPPKVSHWSDLEPLAMNSVSGGTGTTMVNGADEDDLGSGFFDEEAERKAFQDAVAEWRKAPADSSSSNNKKQSSSNSSSNTAGVGASASASAAPSATGAALDEEAERKAFQAAVAEWRGDGPAGKVVVEKDPKGTFTDSSAAVKKSSSSFLMGGGGGAYGAAPTAGDAGMWKNPFAPPDANSGHKVGAGLIDDSDEEGSLDAKSEKKKDKQQQKQQQKKSSSSELPQESGPYAFKDGTLDEAAEHAEFVKAVESWRKQTSGDPAVDPATMSSTASKSQADKLAAALEAEQAAFSKRMQDQKREMEQKLKQSSEHLEKLKAMAAGAESPEKPNTNSKGAYTFSLAPHSVQASVANFAELTDTEKEEARQRAEQSRLKAAAAATTTTTTATATAFGSPKKSSPPKSARKGGGASSFSSGGVRARPLSASQRKGVDYTASASVSACDYDYNDDDGGDMVLEEVDDVGPMHSVFIKEVETVTSAAVGSRGGGGDDDDHLEESYVVEYDSD